MKGLIRVESIHMVICILNVIGRGARWDCSKKRAIRLWRLSVGWLRDPGFPGAGTIWEPGLIRSPLPANTRGIHPMLFQCWASVEDDGPALKQHCVIASCLLGWQVVGGWSSASGVQKVAWHWANAATIMTARECHHRDGPLTVKCSLE